MPQRNRRVWVVAMAAATQNWRIPVAPSQVAWVNGFVNGCGGRTEIMAGRRYRLAQRRKAVGLSQERLAEVVGVDRSTIVRWERADTEPQPWHRPRLAAALNLSVEQLAELLVDVGQPPPQPSERLDYVLKYPGRVDLIAVAHLRERIQRLDERYDRSPSTLLLAETGQVHDQAVFLRQHASTGPCNTNWQARSPNQPP